MKAFITALALATLIAIPMLTPSANAAPMSPASSSFGSNGYLTEGMELLIVCAAILMAFAILRPAQAHRMTGHDYRSTQHWCNWSAASACTRWRARGGKFICPPGVQSVGCQDQRRRERTGVR